MSSTVESMFHPPAPSSAARRHTPPVPLKPKNVDRKLRARCSTVKWYDRDTCWALWVPGGVRVGWGWVGW